MDEKQKAKDEAAEAAKKNDPGGGGGGNAPDEKARIQELETENKELKQQVLALKKKLEEIEAEQQAAAHRPRPRSCWPRWRNTAWASPATKSARRN